MSTPSSAIDTYIQGFPAEVQQAMSQLRQTIRQAAPEATETIKYGMPTFVWQGNLVHFAAFKNYIGLYSVPTAEPAFAQALAGYRTGKGSVQFPLDQPLPLELVSSMVAFRKQENQQKTKGTTGA